jgi:acetolactate synthase-1/2/3 large subunit
VSVRVGELFRTLPQESGQFFVSTARERELARQLLFVCSFVAKAPSGNGAGSHRCGGERRVMLRVVDVFADLLELEQIDCIFTVPGGTAVPLLEAISRRPVRVVVSKDEGGAAFAADGYAWASGKPGVVVTIGGPGVTNALTALACSRAQKNPVILVSGEVSTASMGRGAVQDGSELGLDVLAMSRPVSALSVLGDTPAKAVFGLFEAFRRAIHTRSPVHVSLPLDVQNARVAISMPTRVADYRSQPQPLVALDAVRSAARHLAEAERPALLVGGGARFAGDELLQLAEWLGAPVATTCAAKGVFPEHHPLSVGVFSFGSGALGRSALTHHVDVLCAIGTRLGEFSSMNFSPSLIPSRAFIQIDDDALVFGRNYPVIAVQGEPRATLSALIQELPVRNVTPNVRLSELVQREPRVESAAAELSDARPLRPERVMREIERALPSDACVVADIGTSCLFVAHYLKLRPPQRCYIPMAWSCMAHPLAASLGIRLATQRPTLCVTGDAAFLAKGMELHAAVEANLGNFVCVVLSNRGHGLVRLGTDKLLGANHGVEAGDFRVQPDAAALAGALGAAGRVIEDASELPAALADAFRAGGPVVLDVRVEADAEPPMADRIQGLKTASHAAGPE